MTSVGTIVAGGVALSQLSEEDTQMQDGTPVNKGAWPVASGVAVTGCLMGVALAATVVEACATLFRFVNIGYCNLKIRPLLAMVSNYIIICILGDITSSYRTLGHSLMWLLLLAWEDGWGLDVGWGQGHLS